VADVSRLLPCALLNRDPDLHALDGRSPKRKPNHRKSESGSGPLSSSCVTNSIRLHQWRGESTPKIGADHAVSHSHNPSIGASLLQRLDQDSDFEQGSWFFAASVKGRTLHLPWERLDQKMWGPASRHDVTQAQHPDFMGTPIIVRSSMATAIGCFESESRTVTLPA
jgi:hypothetical protein